MQSRSNLFLSTLAFLPLQFQMKSIPSPLQSADTELLSSRTQNLYLLTGLSRSLSYVTISSVVFSVKNRSVTKISIFELDEFRVPMKMLSGPIVTSYLSSNVSFPHLGLVCLYSSYLFFIYIYTCSLIC